MGVGNPVSSGRRVSDQPRSLGQRGLRSLDTESGPSCSGPGFLGGPELLHGSADLPRGLALCGLSLDGGHDSVDEVVDDSLLGVGLHDLHEVVLGQRRSGRSSLDDGLDGRVSTPGVEPGDVPSLSEDQLLGGPLDSLPDFLFGDLEDTSEVLAIESGLHEHLESGLEQRVLLGLVLEDEGVDFDVVLLLESSCVLLSWSIPNKNLKPFLRTSGVQRSSTQSVFSRVSFIVRFCSIKPLNPNAFPIFLRRLGSRTISLIKFLPKGLLIK